MITHFSYDVTLGNLYHLKLQVFGVCATLHLSGSYIPVYLPGACVVVRLQGLMYRSLLKCMISINQKNEVSTTCDNSVFCIISNKVSIFL